jgi:hypothetical protein
MEKHNALEIIDRILLPKEKHLNQSTNTFSSILRAPHDFSSCCKDTMFEVFAFLNILELRSLLSVSKQFKFLLGENNGEKFWNQITTRELGEPKRLALFWSHVGLFSVTHLQPFFFNFQPSFF